MNFLLAAMGGALGAAGRYAISLIPVKTGFPILTLATNILGALLIGFIVGMTEKRADIPSNAVLFWKTGVCGGFTTFSTFSLEAFTLLEGKRYFAGGAYILLSVVCCVVGVLLGKRAAVLITG